MRLFVVVAALAAEEKPNCLGVLGHDGLVPFQGKGLRLTTTIITRLSVMGDGPNDDSGYAAITCSDNRDAEKVFAAFLVLADALASSSIHAALYPSYPGTSFQMLVKRFLSSIFSPEGASQPPLSSIESRLSTKPSTSNLSSTYFWFTNTATLCPANGFIRSIILFRAFPAKSQLRGDTST